MVAVRAIGEGAAAPEAEADQLAVDAGVDQVAWRRHLRARGAVGQVAAGIRRRRVELQRRQRKVVEIAHRVLRESALRVQPAAPRSSVSIRRDARANSRAGSAARPATPGARSPAGSRSAARRAVATARRAPPARPWTRPVLVREHRLAEEHPAERKAIEAADELIVAPGFDRMRVAQRVQRAVRDAPSRP